MLIKNIAHVIDPEQLQEACEANLGRRLTEKELKRPHCTFYENKELHDAVYGALVECAKEAMNEDGTCDWSDWDSRYENVRLEDMIATLSGGKDVSSTWCAEDLLGD